MLDHTRRILLVFIIFVATGWVYMQWRQDHGGYSLFDALKGETPAEKTVPISDNPKLSAAEVPGLSRLSEELAKLASSVLPSVVSIDTRSLERVPVPNSFNLLTRQELRPGLGSGVIVTKEGHVITNFHVIKNVVVVNNVP